MTMKKFGTGQVIREDDDERAKQAVQQAEAQRNDKAKEPESER